MTGISQGSMIICMFKLKIMAFKFAAFKNKFRLINVVDVQGSTDVAATLDYVFPTP